MRLTAARLGSADLLPPSVMTGGRVSSADARRGRGGEVRLIGLRPWAFSTVYLGLCYP